jgi:hypothetical protein
MTRSTEDPLRIAPKPYRLRCPLKPRLRTASEFCGIRSIVLQLMYNRYTEQATEASRETEVRSDQLPPSWEVQVREELKTLNDHVTTLNTMKGLRAPVKDCDWTKEMETENFAQLKRVAQADRALQATLRRLRDERSCTWTDVMRLTKEMEAEVQQRVRNQWRE